MKLTRFLPFLAILVGALAFSNASAQVEGLDDAAEGICTTLQTIQGSLMIKVIAVCMFVAGCVMIWLKQRGGMGMAAFGVIGFFVIPKSTDLANSLGLSAC